jgi:hypothetical protein
MPKTFDAIDRDLLLRQSQLLYPKAEDWILNMALDAYINSHKEAEAEEETVIINKECDDEVCLSCGS